MSSAAPISCHGICPRILRHFKSLTLGKPVLMGRKTYVSIGKALPGRMNIVLSRSAGFSPGDCTVVNSLDEARAAAGRAIRADGDRRFGDLWAMFAACPPHSSHLVHARIPDGDTVFTGWRGEEWDESSCERHEADDKNVHAYSFITLERVQ